MPYTTKQPNRARDPQWISVQLNVRMPFWYRTQLEDAAAAKNVTPNQLILEVLEQSYKPKPPA